MPLAVTELQALAFRCHRCHLAGPGAADAVAAAFAILGAQAQQLGAALFALSARTAGRPTARAVQARLLGDAPELVRTWGPRDTLHVFDAASDWADVVSARDDWAMGGRRGAMPPAAAVAAALRVLEDTAAPITRTHILPVVPPAFLLQAEARWAEIGGNAAQAARFAAGRLLWKLALGGDACLGGKQGSEQEYVARRLWFPQLPWAPRPAATAALDLTRRYLASYAPATAADVAHFFGARASRARPWIATLRQAGELVDVLCGDRPGLVALARDAAALGAAKADRTVRLLPMWDSYLMGHADKSWTVPDVDQRKQVWRSSAVVAGTVTAGGRVVATWSQATTRRVVQVTVTPLRGWRTTHRKAVAREAAALAAHLERDLDGVVVA